MQAEGWAWRQHGIWAGQQPAEAVPGCAAAAAAVGSSSSGGGSGPLTVVAVRLELQNLASGRPVHVGGGGMRAAASRGGGLAVAACPLQHGLGGIHMDHFLQGARGITPQRPMWQASDNRRPM